MERKRRPSQATMCLSPRDTPYENGCYEAEPITPALAKALGKAPQLGAILAEIIAISDDPDLDASDKRVRIEARKWALAQLAEEIPTNGDDTTNPTSNKLQITFVRAGVRPGAKSGAKSGLPKAE